MVIINTSAALAISETYEGWKTCNNQIAIAYFSWISRAVKELNYGLGIILKELLSTGYLVLVFDSIYEIDFV